MFACRFPSGPPYISAQAMPDTSHTTVGESVHVYLLYHFPESYLLVSSPSSSTLQVTILFLSAKPTNKSGLRTATGMLLFSVFKNCAALLPNRAIPLCPSGSSTPWVQSPTSTQNFLHSPCCHHQLSSRILALPAWLTSANFPGHLTSPPICITL